MTGSGALRKLAAVTFAAYVVILAAGLPGLAQVNRTLTSAPRTRAFTDRIVSGAPGYGLIPPPVDLSHARGMRVLREAAVMLSLPSQYDLRTVSPPKLTAVRDQGYCGSCWAFAAYGSLESCLLPGETTDFSENHMKNTHGFDWSCCDGGNHWIATAYLARWSGPINESSDPYNSGSCTSPAGLLPIKHVQQVDFLPDRAGPLDNDNIKQAVMTNGAVYTTLYMTESAPYYNQATKSLYYNGTNEANHAVCIVGWNDNYSKANFSIQPPGNGAFIVRNSWGSWWGQSGYFYVSYYDAKIGRDLAVFVGADPTDTYDRVYDYDPYGWVNSVGYSSNTGWFANVFTAASDGELCAVSFYTASPGSTYDIYVYVDPNSGPINTGGYSAHTSGTVAAMGYHTISLPSPVPILSGHRFSVAVRLTTPNYNYPIPMEEPLAYYSSAARANSGESYVSYDGTNWTDLAAVFANSNVCLKAFATEPEGLSVSPGTGLSSEGPTGGPFLPQSRVYSLQNTAEDPIEWTAEAAEPWISLSQESGSLNGGESTTVTVSINGGANSLPSGTYTGTVEFTNTTNGIGDTTRTVELAVFDNYEIRPTSFQWIDPSAHSTLPLGDDDVSGAQAMPFPFVFYGKSYSQLYVAANGLAGFAAEGLNAYLNANIPDAAAPNAMICPYWDDLDPTAAGSIRIGTVGTAPNRTLVVSWVGVPPWASVATTFTFQACLREGSCDLVFQYLDVKPENLTFGAGRSATVGIESRSGAAGACYSYNGGKLIANKTALLFTSRGPEISTVKGWPADSAVSLRRAIVTAVFGDVFYIESDDRTSGIRVLCPGHGLEAGMRANVSGVVKTNADGERFIEASSVSAAGEGSVQPVALTGSQLGGGPFVYDPGLGKGQQGTRAWRMQDGSNWVLIDCTGLNNIGLLVKTWGRVTWADGDTFFVDDGSMLRDDSGHTGVRVCAPGLTPPPTNSYVGVVGISSCFESGGVVYRRLLVAGQSDITVLP